MALSRPQNELVQTEERLYKVNLYLNTALMQSPANISKTQKSIEFIKHFLVHGKIVGNTYEHGTHHITLVLTNNNLSETTQWKVRLGSKLKQMNTWIQSSGKSADVRDNDRLFAKFVRMKSANELPDLIVMCTHAKRTSGLVDIIQTLKNGTLNLQKMGIHRITLSIMFDEADKNIRLIVDCLKEIWPLLTLEGLRQDNVIRDIQFITATPLGDFWKSLKKVGISKLQNLNHAIQEMDESSVLHRSYEGLMTAYRWTHDHTLNHSVTDMTLNSVDYARLVSKNWKHSSDAPRIVFAPAETERASHDAMRDLFLTKGFWVFVDNSEPKKGKGFYNPHGIFQSLEAFRKEHNVHGELYDVFRAWRAQNPSASLMLTGWLNVIRGITFNTTGFNFTNMILSMAHAGNLADLLQVSGRGNGDVQYVQPFEIHCPKALWEILNKQITLMKELHETNPEEFEERDFREETDRDRMQVAWTVPRVFSVGQEAFATIQKKGIRYVVESIVSLIERSDAVLADELRKRYKAKGQFQITQPKEDDTYKKYVTDFVKKAEEDRVYNMGLHKDDKRKDGYQIFLDNRAYRIIVSLYNGSRIQDEDAV